MMRALALALPLVLAGIVGCAPPPAVFVPPTPTPTREPGTLAVTALLDLSGTRAPKGDAQRTAMQQWADAQRATPRVKLRIVDVAGSQTRLVLELKHAAELGEADAFVIGVPIVVDEALRAAIVLSKRPVLFTLPISEPSGDAAPWMFGLAPTPEAIARIAVDALATRSTPAVVVSSGTLTAGAEEQVLAGVFEAESRPAPFVLSATAAERDAFTQRYRQLFNAGAAIFFAGAAGDHLGQRRLVPNDAAGTPALFLSYLTDPSDASRLDTAAPITRWPGSRRAAGTALGTHAACAADALAILAGSLDLTGDAERSRAGIESGTFAGIATTYRFTATRHVGADPGDLALLAWENGKVVIARPLPTPAPSRSPAPTR